MDKAQPFDLVGSELIITGLEVTLTFMTIAERTADPACRAAALRRAIAERAIVLKRLMDACPSPHQQRRIDSLLSRMTERLS